MLRLKERRERESVTKEAEQSFANLNQTSRGRGTWNDPLLCNLNTSSRIGQVLRVSGKESSTNFMLLTSIQGLDNDQQNSPNCYTGSHNLPSTDIGMLNPSTDDNVNKMS